MSAQPLPVLPSVDVALDLARQGFDVFPIIPNGKMPAIKDNLVRATRDEAQIRAWFEGAGAEYNVGIATRRFGARYLMVVDVDVKRGHDGYRTLDGLEVVYGELPPTLRVSTPSGGLHLFYASDRPVASSASTKLGKGLDVRGDGGYVVAAGSVVDGKDYRVLGGGTVADAPDWLVDKAGRPAPRTKEGNVIVLLDTDPAIAQARQWLTDVAPLAVEGDGGDTTTFAVAAAVKDFGLSELSCLELLVDHWNDRCDPPWDYEALARKVSNAYAYGKGGIGQRAPEGAFGEVTAADLASIPAPPVQARPRLFFTLARDVKPDLSKVGLVDDWLDQGTMSVVYGESNVGKTFVAIMLAYCIARGEPWAGAKVVQGGVVYVAAEAGGSVEKRVAALQLRFGVVDFPLAVVPCSVDLLRSDGDTGSLVSLIAEAGLALGCPVRLVVIDTLSRAMAGGNENAPEDMTAFVRNVDRIRMATEAHVLVVHHSGKDTAKGARGHSSLRAATDTEIEIADGRIEARKQRDIEGGKSIGFKLESVRIGERADGREVFSAVAILGDFEVRDTGFEEAQTVSFSDAQALRALELAVKLKAEAGDLSGKVKFNEWVEAYKIIKNDEEVVAIGFDYRKNLTVHKLKMKGSFLEEIEPDQWVRTTLEAIIKDRKRSGGKQDAARERELTRRKRSGA